MPATAIARRIAREIGSPRREVFGSERPSAHQASTSTSALGAQAKISVETAISDAETTVIRFAPIFGTRAMQPIDTMGGRDTNTVYFNDCEVPEEQLLGEQDRGWTQLMAGLNVERLILAATMLGIGQRAFDDALAYAKERKQFKQPIADFQGIQFMLADMGMKVEAARQLTYAAAGRSERDDPDLTFFGAAAKCFASDVAMEVTTNAVQVLGGYGFTRDYPVERMMRDAKITQIYEGTNQVQRIVIARQLLAGVQSEL